MNRFFVTALVLLGTTQAVAAETLPARPGPSRLEQRLNEQIPLDVTFRNEAGQDVRLRDYLDGKPMLLVLVQYRCPRLCNLVLNGLANALVRLRFSAGVEFQIVTVSFDPREGSELAAAKKKAYLERYGRPGTEDGWHFLVGNQAAIDQLTSAVGFHYTYDPASDQFGHPSALVVLTPEGRIARYFANWEYPPGDLRLALVEASNKQIGTPIDQLVLTCYGFDSAKGRYVLLVKNVVRGAGVLTVLTLGLFLLVMWRRERRLARQVLAQEVAT